jgi:hypothetical protein
MSTGAIDQAGEFPRFFQVEVAIPDAQAGSCEDTLIGIGRLVPTIDSTYRRVVTDMAWKQGLGELGSAASVVLAAAQRYGDDVHDTVLAHDADLYRELINPDPVANQTLGLSTPANPSHFVLTVTTQEQLEQGGPFDTEGVAERVRRLRGHAGWMVAVVDAGEGVRRTSKGDLERADKALEAAAGVTLNTVRDPVDPHDGDVQVIHSWYGLHRLLFNKGLIPSETPPNEMSPADLLDLQTAQGVTRSGGRLDDSNERSRPTIVRLEPNPDQLAFIEYAQQFRDCSEPINQSMGALEDWTRLQGSAQRRYKDWLLPIAKDIRHSGHDVYALENIKHNLLRGIRDELPEHVAMEYVRVINRRLIQLGADV